jgi:hypothetical protein
MWLTIVQKVGSPPASYIDTIVNPTTRASIQKWPRCVGMVLQFCSNSPHSIWLLQSNSFLFITSKRSCSSLGKT